MERKLINHDALNSAEALYEKLQELDPTVSTINKDSYDDTLYRVGHIRDVLNNADATLVVEDDLNNINSRLANALSRVDQVPTNPSLFDSHIANNVKLALPYLKGQLSAITIESGADQAVKSLRLSVGQHKRHIRDAVEGNLKEFNDTLDEFSESISNQQKRFSTLKQEISNWQTTSSAEFEKLKKEMINQVADAEAEIESALKNLNKLVKSTTESVLVDVQETQEDLAEKSKEMDELIGLTSNKAIVGEHSETAKKEKFWSVVWGVITTVLIIFTAIASYFIVSSTNDASSSVYWPELIGRVVITFVLGAAATYSARQSSEHREAQRYSEHKALHLTSIRQFIRGLPEDQQHKLINRLTDKIFEADSPLLRDTHRGKRNIEGPNNGFKLSSDLVDIVKKLAEQSDKTTK